MKALVFNNKVVDLADEAFEVHPNMVWVDCDNTVQVGFSYKNKKFIDDRPKPVELSYDQKRQLEFRKLDGDGMDVVRKAIFALSQGQPIPQEFNDYVEKVEAIKLKYPKPTG